MKKISAIIIAKNEETMIADCIDSVNFCDEVIVLDGESEDRTREIARKMGAVVYQEPFIDFATARNTGLEKTKGEWVFYIDADERVNADLRKSILEAIVSQKIAGYTVHRKNYYFGHHEWPYIETMERLFKKDQLKGWHGALHESPTISGSIGMLDGFLLHYTHRDLASMLAKTMVWSSAEAKLRYDAHHPKMTWWRFPRVMLSAFFTSYVSQKGYKAGLVGLIESMYQSFSIFVTYAKLWEMQHEKT